jgi:hypothetical protein
MNDDPGRRMLDTRSHAYRTNALLEVHRLARDAKSLADRLAAGEPATSFGDDARRLLDAASALLWHTSRLDGLNEAAEFQDEKEG